MNTWQLQREAGVVMRKRSFTFGGTGRSCGSTGRELSRLLNDVYTTTRWPQLRKFCAVILWKVLRHATSPYLHPEQDTLETSSPAILSIPSFHTFLLSRSFMCCPILPTSFGGIPFEVMTGRRDSVRRPLAGVSRGSPHCHLFISRDRRGWQDIRGKCDWLGTRTGAGSTATMDTVCIYYSGKDF